MSGSESYDAIIKILQDCAKENGISKKLVKKIYDLEAGQTHLPSRTNEDDLRRALLDEVRDKKSEEKKDKKEESKEEKENKEDAEEDEDKDEKGDESSTDSNKSVKSSK